MADDTASPPAAVTSVVAAAAAPSASLRDAPMSATSAATAANVSGAAITYDIADLRPEPSTQAESILRRRSESSCPAEVASNEAKRQISVRRILWVPADIVHLDRRCRRSANGEAIAGGSVHEQWRPGCK